MAREPDSEQMLVLTPECLALPVLWETNHAGLETPASGEFWASSAYLDPSLQNLVAKGLVAKAVGSVLSLSPGCQLYAGGKMSLTTQKQP